MEGIVQLHSAKLNRGSPLPAKVPLASEVISTPHARNGPQGYP